MSDFSGLGKIILLTGIILVVVGALISVAGKWFTPGGGLGWIGRLPGDFFIKRDNVTFYFPLTTSILVSVIGSLLLYVFLRR